MDFEIGAPQCDRGIGSIVTSAQSAGLIDGVRFEPVTLWPDDRGFFLEIMRFGQGLPGHFPAQSTQIAAALSYPGTIKAFHFHKHQIDFWTAAHGMFQVALVDLRQGSPTFGARNTMYVGTLRPSCILIPPGVGHGYKVIGTEAGLLIYATSQFYNPEDEGRIPHNDPGINYDWATQHK